MEEIGLSLEGIKAKEIEKLVKRLKKVGFNATALAKGYEIIKEMKKEKALTILTFTSNMVSSGLRDIFAELVKRKFVDLIITGAGSIEEDIMKVHKPFLLGSFYLSDAELHKKGINRIGDILVPNERYIFFEKFFISFLKKLYKKTKSIAPSDLIFELGKEINDESSILYWATRNNIPIFCPAITDGAIGLNLFVFKQDYKDFSIDVTADMKKLANIVLSAKKTGAIILGGGFAKHHALGINLPRGGLDYCVYVSTAIEEDGSLSGARPREAVSWGKINEKAKEVFIFGDATIIAPLLFIPFLGK
ncbi:MAG: deoxyhypusine synthase [Candidatus Micrarchaeales archaeon]